MRRARGRDRGREAAGQIVPMLVALPLVFLLVRYRVYVLRLLAAIVDELQQPAPSRAALPSPPAPLPDVLSEAVRAETPVVEGTRSMTPTPSPPVADTAPGAAIDELDSVPGNGTVLCPDKFPIKGNATSKIYHLPGTSYYAMTKATICFRSAQAAERAGFRPSKASPIRQTNADGGAS